MKVWTAAALILIAGCAAANPTPLATKTTAVPPSEKGGQEPISLDEIFSGALVGTPPSSPRWSPDGGHLAFAWTAPGEAQRHLWLASPQQPKPIKVGLPSSVSSFDWRADSSGVVCLAGAELWSVSKEGEATRLADVGPGASTLSLAPGGSLGAFLKEGDLWLVDLDRAAVRAATKVGIPPISPLTIGRYNRREREIGPGIWGGPTYAWSPDGRFVAMHHVDRRKMRKVPFPDYLGKETRPNLVRRGYPGDPNEERTVVLLEAATGKLRTLSFAAPAQTQIIGFAWSPSGELLVDRASDTAVDRWLHTVDPSTGDATEIWHGRRESRIYTRFASTWHPDGRRVIFSSDLEERYGLYLLDPSRPQSEPQRLSDPSHDVLSAPRVVSNPAAVVYDGSGPEVSDRSVYRVDLEIAKVRRISALTGDNRGYPSPDGRALALLRSHDVSPPELYLQTMSSSPPPVKLTTSTRAAFDDRPWVEGRYIEVPLPQGEATLSVRVLEPPGMDRNLRYPVVFGPMYSNTVRKRWSGRYSLVQQHLVQRGYIVAQVDVRGSTGHGRAFREAFLQDFAGRDLEDLAAVVNHMKTWPHVDPHRFGGWGSSYGGTLTVYALLTKPGLFKAGVAAAAAVDPYFFGTDDVAIVRRPGPDNPIFERQARASADRLEDHLLIIHGMQDQVVPFKTTVELADVLIRAGKSFDFAFAPGATHGWSREGPYARFLFRKLVDHFDRFLGPGPR